MSTILCTFNIPRSKHAITKECRLTAKLIRKQELTQDRTVHVYKCPAGHVTRELVER